ncbi:helix-turn-helix domain-containing protein [Brevibacillus choshinensis]|uniref:Helix-turn-helix domain-containing protein n=1 Tax=Brevibacillus choshinensis TaxID=54911 RepID=A0ABX7FVM2_BRECH|nr:helix-turn-helix domain-containing protein [Brevibacillus choshinensis]QRG70273.1 helix-turn-helix domain-containing protein [Brevibacillus choshinensis]
MEVFPQFIHRLRQTFGKRSFALWLLASHDRQFRLLHAEGERTGGPIPSAASHVEDERYRWEEQADVALLRLFFPEAGQAVVVASGSICAPSPDSLEILWLTFRLFLAEEMIRTKNDEWSKLLQGIRSISSKLDIDSIIREIIGNALAVIPAADAGLLHLYDPAIDRLVPKATVGFHDRVFQYFKLRIGESIAGKVYQDGHARIYRSHPETKKAMMDISEENYRFLNDAKELRDLNGLLCVPISIESERIGVLVLHQFHQDKVFTDYDLSVLQGFADQTSIALHNAKLYADARTKHDDLVKRNEIHESLKQLFLQNKGTESIIRALERMTAEPVIFADWLEQRYFPEDCHFPLTWEELSLLLGQKRNPVKVTLSSQGAGDQAFLLYPLGNGQVFLGCLLICVTDGELSEHQRVTIEQGSAVLTLDLVKKQSLSSIMYKRAHDLFLGVVESKGQELQERAQVLGLKQNSLSLVVFAYFSRCHDLSILEANIHRLVTKWKWEFSSSHILVYGFHNHVTLLAQPKSPSEIKEIMARLQAASEEWEHGGDASLSIGVGGIYTGIDRIGKSFEEAKKAAHYLLNRGRFGVARYGDLGVNRLILNQSQEEIDAFVRDVFGPLWEGQEKHQELEHTLLTYMECSQSPQQTARELHIHVNTLYQRLRKIEELLLLDLRQPEDILKVQLACHLRRES